MTTKSHCPACQTPLPADAPGGLCPTCLLKRGFGSDTSSTTTGFGPFTPPSVDELRLLFPQLEIIELLGQGGMGAVYKARQQGLDRLVALKILPPTADTAFAERFTREARILAKLNHSGIVNVYDFGQAGGYYYFVMEFVEGVNLRQAQQAHKLTPVEALAIVPKICEALQVAHDAGVVHRDIKPENILLDKAGRVKIADFGLAKLLDKPESTHLTGTHQAMGTMHYMAPEQWEKPLTVDHRADIYSLGVVFYELLTGELPLGRFAPPSRKVQIDVRLDDIVLRTLEKEPELRYQKASDVKVDVDKLNVESFDKLSLDQVKAAASDIQERQAVLKATKARLRDRMSLLLGEDFRRELDKSKARWRDQPAWRRTAFWALLVLASLCALGGMIGGAIDDPRGFSMSNNNLVLTLFFALSIGNVVAIVAASSTKGATDKPVGKWGCVWQSSQAATLLLLLVIGLFVKDPSAKSIVNSTLLALVAIQLIWHLISLLLIGHQTALGSPGYRRGLSWLLFAVGGLGMIFFLSFEKSGGRGQSSFRVGFPDGWIVWQESEYGASLNMNFLTISAGIGIASIFAWQAAWRVWPPTTPVELPAPPPIVEKPGDSFRRVLDVMVTPQPGFARWVGVPMLLLTATSFLAWGLATRSLDDKGAELTFYAVVLALIIAGLALTIQWAVRRRGRETSALGNHSPQDGLENRSGLTPTVEASFLQANGLPIFGLAIMIVALIGVGWFFSSRPSSLGYVALAFQLFAIFWFIEWMWGVIFRLTQMRRRTIWLWAMLAFFVTVLAGLVSFLLWSEPSAKGSNAKLREQLIGKWTWIDGRVGTSEFRTDGTFEERWREMVNDTTDGAIDPDRPLVERAFTLSGQYRWQEADRIEAHAPGRDVHRFRVALNGDELTVLEDDGGVKRLKRAPPDMKKALIGTWDSLTNTDGVVGMTFRSDGTCEDRLANGAVLYGQLRWSDDNQIVKIFPTQAGKAFKVTIEGDTVTLLGADGPVHRLKRGK